MAAMNKLGNMPRLISYTTSECIIAADIVYFGSFADTCKCLCNESDHRKYVVKPRSLWSLWHVAVKLLIFKRQREQSEAL